MDNTQISLIATTITSLIGNVVLVAKMIYDNRNSTETRRSQAEITAYEQLSGLFSTLKGELEKKQISDQAKEQEIEQLEECVDGLRQKIRQARLDLIDLNQTVKDIRRILKNLGIDDHGILETLVELERQLTNISDCLKVKQ